MRWVCYVGSILCTLLLPFQVVAIGGIPAGHIASHGLERDMVNADGTGEGAGYFTFIEGIPDPFFAGSPSEATAFFTFRTAPFTTQMIQNGVVTALAVRKQKSLFRRRQSLKFSVWCVRKVK